MSTRKRWLALAFGTVVLTLAATLLGSRTTPNLTRVAGTLQGLESCATGQLWLSRYPCYLESGCAEDPEVALSLTWTEGQLIARRVEVGETSEAPVPLDQRGVLLRDFGRLESTEEDPHWFKEARLEARFFAGGVCDGEALRATDPLLRINLQDTVAQTPLEWAPRAVVLRLRGPGSRAATLFSRLERLAQ